ncbi:MAG: nitrite/sulfite reductase [Candidatus Brockarchaeota archaeon]|nr:nitrite/sulfite reductase [Candidatus Brockarchaeota archaeon]MBO3809906.1 nitrite/sulfite reductase [Candidatus Brockarchaeota archaeon]
MSISLAEDFEKFIGRYSLGLDSNPYDITGSQHFLRIKVPGGVLTSSQFRQIATLSSKYGRGIAEITDRQDIQLHWIRAEDSLDIFSFMDKMGFTTDMCGQGFKGARYGDVRNAVCCPASGIEKNEIFNPYPIAKEITGFFTGNPDFLDLPRKFKISVSGCGADCTRAAINDLAFVAVKNKDEIGFTVLVGGSIGASLPGPRLARPTKVFIRPEEVFNTAVAVVELYRDYGNRENKAKARFKWLIENWGVEKFVSILENKTGKDFQTYDGPVFLRRTGHEGVQPQKVEGYYYFNIPLLGGRLTSFLMNQVADLADKFGSGELRLTPTQNIIIPNIREDYKKAVLKALTEIKIPMDRSRTRWFSVGCASDFCGKAVDMHAKKTLEDIVEHLEKYFGLKVLNSMDLRINVSGCPNDCGASLISDIGLLGRQMKVDQGLKQVYDIYVGGSLGENPSLGRRVEESVPAEEVIFRVTSFIANYLKNRNPGEDIASFCKRHSKEELKKLLQKPGVNQHAH